MATKSDTIIKIEHLSKSFGDHKVLDDINLDIKRGEFVTLLGPSGCGKTTLLRMLAGFTNPDEGVITMGGKDISGVPPQLSSDNEEISIRCTAKGNQSLPLSGKVARRSRDG